MLIIYKEGDGAVCSLCAGKDQEAAAWNYPNQCDEPDQTVVCLDCARYIVLVFDGIDRAIIEA